MMNMASDQADTTCKPCKQLIISRCLMVSER